MKPLVIEHPYTLDVECPTRFVRIIRNETGFEYKESESEEK